MSRRRVASLLLVLGLVGGACGGGSGNGGASDGGDHAHDHSEEIAEGAAADDAPPAFAEDAATTKVEVVLQDYAFVGLPQTVAGPNVFFAATIKGGNAHELEIVDETGETVDEIPPFQGRDERTLAVVLAPGTYTAQCLVEEGAKTHADLGMKQTFTVT